MSLVALGSTACLKFDIDLGWGTDDTTYDETGGEEEPKPEGPAEPTPSDEPQVSGALWSMTWQPEERIEHIDSGAIGLGLANDQECALLDIDTGALKWTKTRTKAPSGSSLQLVGDELIWAANYADGEGGGIWTLDHYSATGELVDQVTVPGLRLLAVDDAGRIYAHTSEKLTAYAADGDPLWAFELNPNLGVFAVEGLADGVVLVEMGDASSSIQMRARRFDADGVETGLSQFGFEWAFVAGAEIVGDRIYVNSVGGFGLWGSVFAADFDGGFAWASHLAADASVNIAAGPDEGVYAVVAVDGPAELVRIDYDGTVAPLGDASEQSIGYPLAHTGSGGELFVGGHHYDILELHRML